MQLKVINFDSKDIFGSIKQAVFTSALSYAKLYDLLHKQIWRKARGRITIATLEVFPTFNNRPVGFVRKWDIKSQYTNPYSREGGVESFGLNQLFMGQDYRKAYDGDPGDGIYHDDCYIRPRSIETSSTSGHMHAWIYYANMYDIYGDDPTLIQKTYDKNKIYYKEQFDGVILINNVFMEYYVIETVHYRRIVIDYADSTQSYIELGSYDPNTFLGDGIDFGECDSPKSFVGYKNWYNTNQSFIEHGSIVAQYNASSITFSDTLWTSEGDGWIRIYEDGTVIGFSPEYISYGETMDYYPATYSILPMIYLDTGDLAMDRVEFVDRWDEYFELFVHEDSEWWSGIIRPISLIIAAIIIYCSWGALAPLAKAIVVIGYVIYAAGVLTNNTDLMLIGGIMMIGANLYSAFEQSSITTAATAAELSTMSTEQALAGTSFAGTFSGYASAAGMENLLVMPTVESYTSLTLEGLTATSAPYAELASSAGMSVADYVSLSGANAFSVESLFSMGKEIYGIYNNVNQLVNSQSTTPSSETTSEKGLTVTVQNSDDIFDPTALINDVINIL